jgi:branched-subunit amino acid transport protein
VTQLWTVLALSLGTFGLRLSGLALRDVRIPESWERAWRFVPLALLSALVMTSIHDRPAGEVGVRGVALIVAAAVTYRTRRMWVCIVSGMLVYLLLGVIW